MGLNFRKRIKLGDFINLNLGKSGAGFSFGIPGARFSINSKGRKQASFGIPGTGLSYTKSFGTKKKATTSKKTATSAQTIQEKQQALHDYQDALFALSHIHNQASDFIDFEVSPLTYQTHEIGPLQQAALAKLQNYKPSFFDTLLNKADSTRQQLEEDVFKAIEEDEKNRPVLTVESTLAEALRLNQPQAIDQFLDLVDGFKILEDDCQRYTYSYHMNVDEADKIHVDVWIDFEDVLNLQVELDNDKLTTKKLTKTDFNLRCYAYLSSLTLAFVTEALALTPLVHCSINVYLTQTSSAAGLSETHCILAGDFHEAALLPLDYQTLNPIEVIEQNSVDIKFSSRTGFSAVNPIKNESL